MPRLSRLLTVLAAVWASLGLVSPARAEPAKPVAPVPSVVVTLKPLHSLAAAVMGDLGEPYLLVRGAASPHTHALRPSDAKALQEADLVVWVGPMLEGFMARPLRSLSSDAQVLTLAELPDLVRYPTRTGGPWEGHSHGKGHSHHHGHGGTDGGAESLDGHLWLDPRNARVIGLALGEALAAADPGRAALYRANAAALAERLMALDAELTRTLAPLKDRPFVVFHDAYQYLEKRYGLRGEGAITLTPDQRPSASQLSALRRRVKDLGAVCIFSEPQFQPSLVRTLAEGTAARTGVLDPEGAALSDGADLYEALLRFNAQSLQDCLGATAG